MMANWFHDTNLPRMLLGATSAIYIGQMAEARPTPMPPKMRYRLNAASRLRVGLPYSKNRNSGKYEPSADRKKKTPASTSERLRPRREAKNPDNALPMMQPINALAEVKP